jgi:hypothetical protein
MDRANLPIDSGSVPAARYFDMHGPEAVLMHVPHITASDARLA